VDISSEMIHIDEDSKHLLNHPLFLGYAVAEIEHLPFHTETLDAMVSLRFFGHLPPILKKQALHEFKRITRSGAVVMFALNNLFLKLKRHFLQSIRSKPKTDMWFPTNYEEIKSLALSMGWNFKYAKHLVPLISESIMCVFNKTDNSVEKD